MNKSRSALLCFCLGALLLTISVGYFIFQVEVVRYRMTVVASTTTGNIEASAVREVRRHKGIKLFPEMADHKDLIGEAIVLPISNKDRLFAIMRSRNDKDYGFRVVLNLLASGKKEILLEPEQYPMFVAFRNELDPLSVYELASSSAVQGKQFKIEKVKIEITNDQVTWTGIEDKLPWLQKISGRLDGEFLGGLGGLANALDKWDFFRKS